METSVQHRPKNLDLSIVIQNWASLTPTFYKRLHPVCLSCSGFRWHWTLTDCWCDWTGSFMSDQGYDLWCAYDLLPDRKTSSDSHSVSEDSVWEKIVGVAFGLSSLITSSFEVLVDCFRYIEVRVLKTHPHLFFFRGGKFTQILQLLYCQQ